MYEVTTSKVQTVGEKNYIKGNFNRPRNSNNDDFISELSYILNNALTGFQKIYFLYE